MSAINTSPAVDPDRWSYFGMDQGRLIAMDQTGQWKWYNDDAGPEPIHGSPIVDGNGRVYFGGDNNMAYCVKYDGHSDKGITLWNFNLHRDVRSSPSISSDNRVYFISNYQRIYAFE